MVAEAAQLGPFASEQGSTSRWATAGAFLGLGASGVAAAAILIDLGGRRLDVGGVGAREIAVPLGAAALIASMAGLYNISTAGLRGRALCIWGAMLGVLGSLVALVHGSVQSGTLRLDDLGIAYFDRDILATIWPDIARAAVNTIKYAAIAEGTGIVIGLIVSVLAISKRRWVRLPAIAYVDVVRGLPLLMLIILVAFAPVYVGITLPSITAALIALTINSSAYVAEIFRAGIQAVDKGQMDAARSLGMPYPTAMIQVVIPQAFRKVIPPLMNEFIALVKDTSLIFLVGLTLAEMELLTRARTLSSSTFSATPLMAAAIAYLVITLPLTRLVNLLERRLATGGTLTPMLFQSQRASGRLSRID